LAERQIVALLHHEVTEGQSFAAALTEFDTALAAPPEPESETDRIRRELGV